MNKLSTWNRASMAGAPSTGHRSLLQVAAESSRRFSRRMSSFISTSSRQSSGPDVTNGRIPLRRMNSSRDDKMKYYLQVQGLLYILAFFFVYMFSFIARIFVQVTGGVPFALLFLARTLNPLQGFFNMLIFTRMSVSKLRSQSGLSWIKAIWVVLRCKEDQYGSPHDSMLDAESSRQNRVSLAKKTDLRKIIVPKSFEDEKTAEKKTEKKHIGTLEKRIASYSKLHILDEAETNSKANETSEENQAAKKRISFYIDNDSANVSDKDDDDDMDVDELLDF